MDKKYYGVLSINGGCTYVKLNSDNLSDLLRYLKNYANNCTSISDKCRLEVCNKDGYVIYYAVRGRYSKRFENYKNY